MKIIFAKSNWEVYDLPLNEFISRVVADGFNATEIYLPGRSESHFDISKQHADQGLKLIAQINTTGDNAEAHAQSLKRNFTQAFKASPIFVNCHTGRDIFSFDENVSLFKLAQQLSLDYGVKIRHETHRGRALFSAPATRLYLQAIPDLQLTADFSHWYCVHESDLLDQPENMSIAVSAAHHIHARVGFREGPQVAAPISDAFKPWLDLHMALWKKIIDLRTSDQFDFLSITPEFGPPPYMPLNRFNQPVADPWAVNVWMRDYLATAIENGFRPNYYAPY